MTEDPGEVTAWWRGVTTVTRWVMVGIAGSALFIGFIIGRLTKVPGTSEFWTIAAQPVVTLFAGLAAVWAASLAYITGRRAWYQSKEHHRSDRSWSRLQWVIDKGASPGTGDPGLPQALRDKLLDAIETEALSVDDEALKEALLEYKAHVSDEYLAGRNEPVQ